MLAAVEVLDALVVLLAQIWFELSLVVFVVLIQVEVSLQAFLEVDGGEQRVIVHNLVENVEVEGKLVNGLNTLENFAAHWAANSIVPKEVAEAGGAESMSATHYDPWDSLAHVELKSTEVAKVQLSRFVASSYLWEVEFVAGGWSDG